MGAHHVVHGLRIDSSFPLTGVPTVAMSDADSMPRLRLELRTPASVERDWESSGTLEWRGRQGDGEDLSIELGASGDRLFSYGAHTRFRLSPDMDRLDCAPDEAGLDWVRLLIGKVLPSISVMLGYEALHAAAVDFPQGVVAIMAPSGTGKSTLAVELIRRGHALFADDQLTLRRRDGEVWSYPGTPHMNLAPVQADALSAAGLGGALAAFGNERWCGVEHTSRTKRPVAMLCLLDRASGHELDVEELPASPLPLSPFVLGLPPRPSRQRERFELYADLARSTPLARLTTSSDDPPALLADLVERAVARRSALVPAGR